MIYGLAGVSATILWTLALFSTRALLESGFGTNTISLLRFGLAAIITHFLLPASTRKAYIHPKDKPYFLALSLGGVSLFYFCENSGVRFTTISNTALIIATIPLFTLIVAHFFYHKRMCWQNIIGLPLGLAGTAMIFIKDILHGTSLHIKGDIFVLVAVMLWVLYSFAYKKIGSRYFPAFITYKAFVWGSVFLVPMVLFEVKAFSEISFSFKLLWHILFLALFPSYLAYLLWNMAIQHIGIKITSNFILLSPIYSIVLGVLFLHEPFTLNLIAATIAIIIGAWLTSISSQDAAF